MDEVPVDEVAAIVVVAQEVTAQRQVELPLFYGGVPARQAAQRAFAALQQNFRTVMENRALSPQVAFSDTLSVTLSQNHPRRRPLNAARVDSVAAPCSRQAG